jgi:hypothetical protein
MRRFISRHINHSRDEKNYDFCNFTFSFFLQRTKSWGYKQADGSFDGMIGALVKKETDVGGSSIFFRAERHEGE